MTGCNREVPSSSEAARAEGAEIGEVLAQLRRLNASSAGERLAGNGTDAVFLQARQAAQINRETINRLARDDWAFRFLQAAKNKRALGARQARRRTFALF
jgi:hypothetical protein